MHRSAKSFVCLSTLVVSVIIIIIIIIITVIIMDMSVYFSACVVLPSC